MPYISLSRRLWIGQILMFSALALGSVLTLFYPSVIITNVADEFISTVWAWFYLGSALTCLAGAIFRREGLEAVGLPLLAACLIFHMVCADLYQTPGGDDTSLYLTSTVDFAFAVVLLMRMQDILHKGEEY